VGEKVQHAKQTMFGFISSETKEGQGPFDALFNYRLNRIQSSYGGGIAAFFTFLKRLTFLNLILFTIELIFVVLPGFGEWEAVKARVVVAENLPCYNFNKSYTFIPAGYTAENATVKVVEEYWLNMTNATPFESMEKRESFFAIANGKGVFGYSPLFFGGYEHATSTGYRIDLAYISVFTICTIIMLGHVFTRAFRSDTNGGSVMFSNPTAPYTTGIFTCWDFGLTNHDTVETYQKTIYDALITAFADTMEVTDLEKQKQKKKENQGAGNFKAKLQETMNLLQQELHDTEAKRTQIHSILNVGDGPTHEELELLDELDERAASIRIKIKLQDDEAKAQKERHGLLLRRIAGWTVWVLIMCAVFIGVGFLEDKYLKKKQQAEITGKELGLIDEFLLSGSLSAINGALPQVWGQVGKLEKYEREDTEVTVSIVRSFFMRLGTIWAISLAMYTQLKLSQPQYPESNGLWGVQQDCCAGTQLGQEAYKMVFVDVVFTIVAEIVVYWGLAKFMSGGDGKTDLDVGQAVIYCCYRQALLWIGMLFSPPLAFIGAIGSFVSFHVYYWLVFKWCKPSSQTLSSRVSSRVFNQALALMITLTAPILVLIIRVYVGDALDSASSLSQHPL
jgi:hypothetical protein